MPCAYARKPLHYHPLTLTKPYFAPLKSFPRWRPAKSSLQAEAVDIFSICMYPWQYTTWTWMDPQRSKWNSRLLQLDSKPWCLDLNLSIFNWLNAIWQPQTVDRFANVVNSQMKRFNLRFWSPGSKAVDAFTYTCAGEQLVVPTCAPDPKGG